MKRFITIAVFALLTCVSLYAQQGVPGTIIQQSPTELRACSPAHSDAAINTQVTVTLTPPSGQSVYICGIDFSASQNATATVNTNLQFTSTNLGSWKFTYSLAATANTMFGQAMSFAQPLKSVIPGTAVTVVSPAATAQTIFSINVYYYFAP